VNLEEVIQYWLTTADEDWRVAQHLFQSKDYPYALFFGHLYLEKILKALVVRRTGAHAPFTHSLLRLAEERGLPLTKEQRLLLVRVTDYNIEARYPDERLEFRPQWTQQFCRSELSRIEGLTGWIRETAKF